MKGQLNAVKRDEVLFAFHRACPRPTTEQVAEWTKNYPEFAEDIRIHAAIRLDWEARPEEASEEPDDLLLRRGHSRALNAIYNAKASSSSSDIEGDVAPKQGARSAFRSFASKCARFFTLQLIPRPVKRVVSAKRKRRLRRQSQEAHAVL